MKDAIEVVRKTYPEASVFRVAQAFYPMDGWRILAWVKQYAVQEQVEDVITRGATGINFEIIDQYGLKRFPDFHKDEFSN